MKPEEIFTFQLVEPDAEEIELRFSYHEANSRQVETMSSFRIQAKTLAHEICNSLPPCREKSLALTKLEECVMHFNSGIVRRE